MSLAVRKYLLLGCLASSPLTLLPICTGTIGGVLFSLHSHRSVANNVQVLLSEVETFDQLEGNSVTGATSFTEWWDDNTAFHRTRLRSTNWAAKLGFLLPQEFGDPDAGVDKLADLSHLVRVPGCGVNNEYWVYVTGMAWPGISDSSGGWDNAFDDIIQRSYWDKTLNETGFAFLERVMSPFLLNLWEIRPPSLIHFVVGDEAPLTEDGLTYDVGGVASTEDLRQVHVRIIDLPLQGVYLGLPLKILPTPKQQMRALIGTARLYEQFDEYSQAEHMMKRFNEYMDDVWKWKGTPLPYIRQIESWSQDYITMPLRIEGALEVVQGIVFVIVLSATELARLPFALVAWLKDLWLEPPTYRWGLRDPAEPRLGLMEGMFAGFVQEIMGPVVQHGGPTATGPTATSNVAQALPNLVESPAPTTPL